MLLPCAHPVASRSRFAWRITGPETWTHKEPADAGSLAEDLKAPLHRRYPTGQPAKRFWARTCVGPCPAIRFRDGGLRGPPVVRGQRRAGGV